MTKRLYEANCIQRYERRMYIYREHLDESILKYINIQYKNINIFA